MPPERSGDGNKTVWVAVIAGLAAILAAVVPVFLPPSKSGDTKNFVGIVRKKTDGSGINLAKVTAIVDQDTPEVIYTDSDGSFHLRVSSKAQSLLLQIEAAGFNPTRVDANVHRLGPEEIYLPPIQSLSENLTHKETDRAVTKSEPTTVSYDTVLDQQLTDIQQSTWSFLNQLGKEAGTPAAGYENNRSFYETTDGKISTLITRASSQPGTDYDHVTTNLSTLQEYLKAVQRKHELGGDKGLDAITLAAVREAVRYYLALLQDSQKELRQRR